MKIDKKLIKELVDNLKEFELTELEYQEGQTKIKVSKASKGLDQIKTSAVTPQNKAVLKSSDESDGVRVKSPIIGTAYLAAEPGAKKFIEVVNELEERFEDISEDLEVAIIGCYVNGPGESKAADIGLTGASPNNLLYIDGLPSKKLTNEELVDEIELQVRDNINSSSSDTIIARG